MRVTSVIFEDWSVRSILADEKHQTRRIMTTQPETDGRGMVRWPWQAGFFAPHVAIAAFTSHDDPKIWRYGRAGDRIRVKEAWRTEELRDGLDGIRFRADGAFVPIESSEDAAYRWTVAHASGKRNGRRVEWRSSMFLPRWASRIALELTDVRVQRLHDISEEDARAEGVKPIAHLTDVERDGDYRRGYEEAWKEIHGARSWDSNCWCWCLTFKRIT